MAPRWPQIAPIWLSKSLKTLGKINIFALGPHLGPKKPHDGPRLPKMAPRWLHEDPRWPQDGPRSPQEASGFKSATCAGRLGESTIFEVPGGHVKAILGPTFAILGHIEAILIPGWPQDDPRSPMMAQDGRDGPKMAPRSPQGGGPSGVHSLPEGVFYLFKGFCILQDARHTHHTALPSPFVPQGSVAGFNRFAHSAGPGHLDALLSSGHKNLRVR